MELYIVKWEDVALSAATAKTVGLLSTPATRRAKIKEFSISFDGVTASNTPVLCEFARYTVDGTGTAFTPLPLDPAAPAALCSSKINYSAEPTIGSIMRVYRLTPNGGLYTEQFPLGDETLVAVSSFLGLRLTAAQTVNTTGYIVYQE